MSKERYLERIRLAEKTNAPYGVGNYVKGVRLIVGEQASDPTNAPEQRPFCCTKGCSGWLNKMLDIEMIPEYGLFWVNALNNDGTMVNLKALVEELQPAEVIALGHFAKNTCDEFGVDAKMCFHPQYWRRFRSKERYPLLDMLQVYNPQCIVEDFIFPHPGTGKGSLVETLPSYDELGADEDLEYFQSKISSGMRLNVD